MTNPVEQWRYLYDNCGTNDIFRRDDILFIADRNIGFLIFQIGDDITIPFEINFSLVIILFLGYIFTKKRFHAK